MRVELVAQHRQLRRRRLHFQPLEPVGLLLHLKEEIDRVIKRGPGTEQREVEIECAQKELEARAIAHRIERREHPGIDKGRRPARYDRDDDGDLPGHDRLLPQQEAIAHRHQQGERIAGHG